MSPVREHPVWTAALVAGTVAVVVADVLAASVFEVAGYAAALLGVALLLALALGGGYRAAGRSLSSAQWMGVFSLVWALVVAVVLVA